MATTYRSNAAGVNFDPYDRPEGAAIAQEFSVSPTASVVSGDVFILGKIPPGATLLAFTVDVPTLDGGTSNATLATSVGDASNAARFFTSNTATFHNTATRVSSFLPINTVTSTTAKGTIAGSLPVAYENASDLRLTVTANANSAVSSGTLKGFYLYTMRPAFNQPVR